MTVYFGDNFSPTNSQVVARVGYDAQANILGVRVLYGGKTYLYTGEYALSYYEDWKNTYEYISNGQVWETVRKNCSRVPENHEVSWEYLDGPVWTPPTPITTSSESRIKYKAGAKRDKGEFVTMVFYADSFGHAYRYASDAVDQMTGWNLHFVMETDD